LNVRKVKTKIKVKGSGRGRPLHMGLLVAIVIAIVPVVFFTPATLVLIPPAMMFAPAPFPCLVQFATLVVGLATVAAVALNGFVQFMIPVRNAALTALHALSLRARPSHEQQNSHCCRQRHE
jgi:hypothetical protein